jgi:hypothetical protein
MSKHFAHSFSDQQILLGGALLLRVDIVQRFDGMFLVASLLHTCLTNTTQITVVKF